MGELIIYVLGHLEKSVKIHNLYDALIKRIAQVLKLDEGEVERRLSFVNLSREEIELLKEVHNRLGERDLEEVFRAFYDHLLSFEETRRILESEPGLVEKLKSLQAKYLKELLRADYNTDYALSRLRAGHIHESRQVEPKFFTGAFAKWMEVVAPLITEGTPQESVRRLIALFKAVIFDITLSLEAYFFSRVLQGRGIKYEAIFNGVPDGIIIADLNTLRIVEANDSALGMLGRSEEDITAIYLVDIHPTELRDNAQELYRRAGREERVEGMVSLLNQTTGERIPTELTISCIEIEGSRYLVCIYRDIRGRIKGEEEMRKVRGLYISLSEINRIITSVRDRDRLFEESVRAIKENGDFKCVGIFKVGQEEPLSIYGEYNQEDTQAVFTIEGGSEEKFYIFVAKEGQDRFTQDEVKLLNEIARDLSFAINSITFHEEAVHTKSHDPITDLPNRTFFNRVLEDRVVTARVKREDMGLVVIDIDNFGEMNQALGHRYGDDLLRAVADRLRDTVRESDFLARVGADEFGILVLSSNVRVAVERLIERIRRSFSRPVVFDSREVFVSFSYGISIFPDDGETQDQLLINAVASLNRAKSLGGDRAVYYSVDVDKTTEERLNMRTNLRKALDKEEFRLYYQPKVDLKTGEIADCEALIRWVNDGKIIPPVKFIPLLEESGLIHRVGEWVVSEACRQVREWQERGINVSIAVNISPNQLKLPYLADRLLYTISSNGGAYDRLEIEITESAIMEDTQTSVDFLNSLASYGVKTYIDDFGTGYSSLAYLKRLPVYALKIDREFIKDLPEDRDNIEIVKATISLANTFGLKTVAEGVETKEQVELLKDLGCDYAQGFYFGKPMPAEEFEEFVRSWGGY